MENLDPTRSLEGKRILLVDDSPQITALLKEIFAISGAQPSAANTGTEALERLREDRFDLIVLDLVMPRPNGHDIITELHHVQPGLLDRMILLTGDRYTNETVEYLRDSGIPVVFKPFRIDDLRQAACDVLDKASHARAG
jgi:DNA-binding NtrC family response regulator